MKRRPKLPTIYNAVSGYDAGGSVTYIAHLVTRAGDAYHLGAETTGDGGSPADHPDQQYWLANRARIKTALTNAAGSISRIEIDCTLMPCDGQYGGCLFQVPLAIKAHLTALKTEVGRGRFALLDAVILDKIPLRIFSHRRENRASQVIFCLVGDGRQALIDAYAASEEWLWVEYRAAYLGPRITVGRRIFEARPVLDR